MFINVYQSFSTFMGIGLLTDVTTLGWLVNFMLAKDIKHTVILVQNVLIASTRGVNSSNNKHNISQEQLLKGKQIIQPKY